MLKEPGDFRQFPSTTNRFYFKWKLTFWYFSLQVSWFVIVCVLIGYSSGLSFKRSASQPEIHQAPETTNENRNQGNVLKKMGKMNGKPTNTRIVRLYNKNGFFLRITNTTKQTGIRRDDTRECKYKVVQVQDSTGFTSRKINCICGIRHSDRYSCK